MPREPLRNHCRTGEEDMTQSVGFHENEDLLDPATKDRHRAIASLNEELEAVDWYDQRVAAATDDELRAILAHNRDEEKEHAVMTLEWLRRHDAALDQQLRTYLFKDKPVLEVEAEADEDGASDGSLEIGSLK
jgi:ferritin-like protein